MRLWWSIGGALLGLREALSPESVSVSMLCCCLMIFHSALLRKQVFGDIAIQMFDGNGINDRWTPRILGDDDDSASLVRDISERRPTAIAML